MTVGRIGSVYLPPDYAWRRQRPIPPDRVAPARLLRRTGEPPAPRPAPSPPAERAGVRPQSVNAAFAAQAIARDLLFDLRPEPHASRKLVAHYARADGLLAPPPRPTAILV